MPRGTIAYCLQRLLSADSGQRAGGTALCVEAHAGCAAIGGVRGGEIPPPRAPARPAPPCGPAGGFAQQIADLLQPGLNQAVQQAVDHAMQPVQQALQLLREQLVRSDNLTKRLHNRTIGVHVGADVPLMAPCKERHPPPPAAGAAAGAAAAFGALPPPGMFPATLAAFFEVWEEGVCAGGCVHPLRR